MEGCYIPFDWKDDFDGRYLDDIRFYCLVMSKKYIEGHFADIQRHANDIEVRLDDSGCTRASVLAENARYLELCRKYDCNCILIDDDYRVDIEI